MNNKEFIGELSERLGYTKTDTSRLLNSLIEEMGNAFEEGDSVSISAFGTFEVKKRMERILINPSTGQKMMVPPKLVLNFKPSSVIKESINKK